MYKEPCKPLFLEINSVGWRWLSTYILAEDPDSFLDPCQVAHQCLQFHSRGLEASGLHRHQHSHN